MMLNIRFRLALPLLFVAICPSFVFADIIFTRLGDLPGGGVASEALAISANGSVVVGRSLSADGYEAFRWTSDTGLVGLGADQASLAQGVSADGNVITGVGPGSPFRWTPANGTEKIGYFNDNFKNDWAHAVSADGNYIVGEGGISNISQEYQAYRWSESGGFEGLGFLAGGTDRSTARAVSADGSVIVGRGSSDIGTEAFLWTEESGMVGLGDLAGGSVVSAALGVSADGEVVVGQGRTGSGNRAFRWTEAEGMSELNFATAFAVSGDGTVIGGQSDEAVIWDEVNGVRSVKGILEGAGINVTGWDFLSVRGISHDGKSFTGIADNPDGNREAFLVQLDVVAVAEPGSTSAFCLVGAVAVWRLRRRRQLGLQS